MKKWANYLISKVRYDSENLISIAMRHQDTDLGITYGEPVDRLTIASDIKNGLSYITIYNGKNSWKKGHKIQTFSIGGAPYLRIDGNKVKLDYLGDLPELLFIKSNSVLKSTPEISLQSDLEVSTSKQLEKIESLQKQIQELENTQQSKLLSTSRGSLPKESVEELPQELDLVPEPESPIPFISIQLTQLDDLQIQIDKLQNILSNPISFEFKSAEEKIDKQFSEVMKSKNQNKKLEIEYDFIQALQNQNKKT